VDGAETASLDRALERVGDRWSLLLVEALLTGPGRWSDLATRVPAMAPNVLADRLRRLEGAGVLRSSPYSQRPLRLVYELTPAGRELAGPIRLLADWGGGSGAGTPRHQACGTPMEVRWYCPTCGRSVRDEESGDLHFV
jgi:DNA-binding HxlR family transcriptional regulator